MKLTRLFLLCAAVAIAAACSSGGSGSAPSTTPMNNAGQGSTPALDQTVSFTVVIPPAGAPAPAGSISRKRATSSVYVSPNTGSLNIRLVAVNGVSLSAPPPANPATNVPPACIGSATGCRVSVPSVVAAIGVNTYTVTTFAGPNGSGAVVSSGVISVTVSGSGTVGTIGGDPTQLALGGFVASLSLTVTPLHFTFGVPSSATIVVTPKDAAGATIIGNAEFAFPITLSASGTGFTLSGQGLQPDGTIQLIEPQAASPPIVLKYDGTGTSVTVDASSQNGSGATVTAPAVTIVAPTPTPVPTSTSVSTLPPVGPTPVPSGPTPVPTPAPSSFFVLNEDNSVFEYSAPVNGTYSIYSRRGFGGASLDCAGYGSGYALYGITTDPSGNVYVGAPGFIFNNGGIVECPPGFYNFPPGFSGPGGPAQTMIQLPSGLDESETDFGLAFDVFNGNKLDFSDDSLASGASGIFVARVATTGGTTNPHLGDPVAGNAAEPCFVSPGMPNADPTCGENGSNKYFDDVYNENLNIPFTVDSAGNLYIVAYDESNPNGSTPSILKVTPANQVSQGTVAAAAAWIEGPNTLMFDPVSLAYDAAKNSLWVYDSGKVDIDGEQSGTPPPSAGNGTYLLEYPLSAFSGSGSKNITPTAYLSGQSFSRFATYNPNLTVLEPNTVAVGGGYVYVANQFSGNGATPAPPLYNGEVDAYSDAVTGTQQNTIAPFIYYGSNVRGPLGVAFGPHGTALGQGNLLRLSPNFRALQAAVSARQRRTVLLLRQRARALRALRRH